MRLPNTTTCLASRTVLPLPVVAVMAALLLLTCLATTFADEATVVVTTKPAEAKVYVNGYFKGFTPCTVIVNSATAESKQYRFTIIKLGYKKWDMQVGLTAGSRKRIDAYLKRLPDALAGKTVCIDPGHPSETSPGCTGPSGVTENHINWAIALQLKQALAQRGVHVVMTKSAENQKVTNRRRAEIANNANSDIMIRLHCDAASHSGFSLYYPDRTGTKHGNTGPPGDVRSASRTAADALYRGMKSVLAGTLPGRGVHGDSATYIGSKQGALTGSIFSLVPVVTIEMCVLTISSDERFISSARGQQLMVKALFAGLETYFRELGSSGGCNDCPDT